MPTLASTDYLGSKWQILKEKEKPIDREGAEVFKIGGGIMSPKNK